MGRIRIILKQIQKESKTTSDRRAINFCNKLLSYQFKFELIHLLANQLKDRNISVENIVVFSNKKEFTFPYYEIKLSNETDCEMFSKLGEYRTIHPNSILSDLTLLYKFVKTVDPIVKSYLDEPFNSWNFHRICKSFFENGFYKTIDYIHTSVENKFSKKTGIAVSKQVLKEKDRFKFLKEEYDRNLKLIDKRTVKSNYEKDKAVTFIKFHQRGALQILINEPYPQILYFNKGQRAFRNYEINNFDNYEMFKFNSIVHVNPWFFDVVTEYASIATLITSEFYLILKANDLIVKTENRLEENRENKRQKFKKFFDDLSKEGKKSKSKRELIEEIESHSLRNELLFVYDRLFDDFKKSIEDFELYIDDIMFE